MAMRNLLLSTIFEHAQLVVNVLFDFFTVTQSKLITSNDINYMQAANVICCNRHYWMARISNKIQFDIIFHKL